MKLRSTQCWSTKDGPVRDASRRQTCERRFLKDGPAGAAAFTSVLRETGSQVTTQEGASVRLGVRTPESGENSRRRSKRAGTPRRGTNPQNCRPQGTAGTNSKTGQVPPQVLFNLDLGGHVALRRDGDQFDVFFFCLLQVVV